MLLSALVPPSWGPSPAVSGALDSPSTSVSSSAVPRSRKSWSGSRALAEAPGMQPRPPGQPSRDRRRRRALHRGRAPAQRTRGRCTARRASQSRAPRLRARAATRRRARGRPAPATRGGRRARARRRLHSARASARRASASARLLLRTSRCRPVRGPPSAAVEPCAGGRPRATGAAIFRREPMRT